MTIGQAVFLSLLYQDTQVFDFEYRPEPPDYTFFWFLVILAVVLFPVFFFWIRRRNRPIPGGFLVDSETKQTDEEETQ
jgi:phosphotransferase system  glucose/maltose/N-acetylglucosamine-specific IIC component